MTNVPVQITRDGKLADLRAEFNRPKTCLYLICFGGDNDPIMDLIIFHGNWPIPECEEFVYDARKKTIFENPGLVNSPEYQLGMISEINQESQITNFRPGYTHCGWTNNIVDALYTKDRFRKFFRTNCKYEPTKFFWHVGFNSDSSFKIDRVGFRQSQSYPDHMSSTSCFFRHIYVPTENVIKIYFSNAIDEGMETYEFGLPKETIFPKEHYRNTVWFETEEKANGFLATLS